MKRALHRWLFRPVFNRFDVVAGLLIVGFSSTLGAPLSFLLLAVAFVLSVILERKL